MNQREKDKSIKGFPYETFDSWESSINYDDLLSDEDVDKIFNRSIKDRLKLKRKSNEIWSENKSNIKSLRDYIKQVRIGSGLSEDDIAKMIRVSTERYSSFEQSNRRTSETKDIKFIVGLLGFFDIALSKLVEILSFEENFQFNLNPTGSYALTSESVYDNSKKHNQNSGKEDLRPSLSEFFYKLQKEIKNQKLEHLLPK